jgi:MarR family
VPTWTFLTTHARVLLLVAHDPGVRLRDIAASLGITERSAFGVITDLVEAGYVVKEKEGRRNRYHIQAHLPLPEPGTRERTVGEVLALLTGADAIVAGQPAEVAEVAGSPGSGQDGQQAAAGQVRARQGNGAPQAGQPAEGATGREETRT